MFFLYNIVKMTKKININFVDFENNIENCNLILKNNPNLYFSKTNYDFLICFGGDGNFLETLKQEYAKKINIIHHGTGHLNFLSNFKDNNDNFNDDNFHEFGILEIKIDNVRFVAINEIEIFKINSTSKYTLSIDDNKFYEFQATGFVVNTSIGSTGINRTIGGPLFFNSDLFCFNELLPVKSINSNALSQPMIFSNQELLFENLWNDNDFIIKIDGKSLNINSWKFIKIKLIKSCAKININYSVWLESINKKLI